MTVYRGRSFPEAPAGELDRSAELIGCHTPTACMDSLEALNSELTQYERTELCQWYPSKVRQDSARV
jgi:hypothetical protein